MDEADSIKPDEVVKTGVEFPKKLLKLVRKRVIDRDIKMKDAVSEAFQAWLAGTSASAVPPPIINRRLNETTSTESTESVISSCLSPEFTEEHRQLEKILRGGVADEAIKHNLEAFARLTELEHGQGNPDPGESGPDFKPGMEQLRASAERARRRLQDSKDAGEGIRPKKTKPLKKASGWSGD